MDFEKISINNNDFYKAKRAILDGFVPSCPEKAKEEIARFRRANSVLKLSQTKPAVSPATKSF